MVSSLTSTASCILISLTVLMLSGCIQEIRTDLVHHQFEVGERSFTISLPSDFQRDPDASLVQFLRPEYRSARSLRFTASLPTQEDLPHTTILHQGGKLRYDIVTDGGGSGGIEAELSGFVELDAASIGVIATAQDEFSPNPEWCIEFLHTLRLR